MKIVIALTFLLFLKTSHSGIQTCMGVGYFDSKQNDYLETTFNASEYMRKQKIVDPPSYFKKLGKGAFGVVSEASLKTRDSKIVTGAFKAIKYGFRQENDVDKELEFMQNVAPKYPLYFTKYYNCVSDINNKSLLIFTEKLDGALPMKIQNKPKAQNKLFTAFKTHPLSVRIGLLLNMAFGIFLIHINNYAHYDIKPDNFLIKDAKYPIIKVSDYGLIADIEKEYDTFKPKGMIKYMDSYLFSIRPRLTRKSDIYSLGLTFIQLFYDVFYELQTKDIALPQIIGTNKYDSEGRYRNYVQCLIKNNCPYNYIISDDMKSYPQDKTLKALFISMINLNPDKRPSSKEVVTGLYFILKSIDPNSIYLPENYKQLYNQAYTTNNLNNEPTIAQNNDQNRFQDIPINFLSPKYVYKNKFACAELRDFVLSQIAHNNYNDKKAKEQETENDKPVFNIPKMGLRDRENNYNAHEILV